MNRSRLAIWAAWLVQGLALAAGLAPLPVRAESPPSSPSFGVSELVALIESKGLRTIPEVVAALPAELRANAVFLKASESAQSASPLKPRVIAWNVPAGFALSVNATDAELGAQTIEMMQFDRASARFHFVSLHFPLKLAAGEKLKPQEPASCLVCHGQDPRPVWQEYPKWEGAYGSDDDFMPEEENASFRSFVSQLRTDPIYAPFLPPEGERPAYPYRENKHPGGQNPSGTFSYRPNLRLGAFLTRLNALRTRRIAIGASRASKLAPLAASVMACPGARPLPEALTAAGLEPADLDPRYTRDDPADAGLDPVLSYFDGASSARELLAARIAEAVLGDERASGLERTLTAKYLVNAGESAETRLDPGVLSELDAWGGWVSLPYVSSEATIRQKREPFRGSFAHKYAELCEALTK